MLAVSPGQWDVFRLPRLMLALSPRQCWEEDWPGMAFLQAGCVLLHAAGRKLQPVTRILLKSRREIPGMLAGSNLNVRKCIHPLDF